jgi:hypothetical protein
MAEYRIFFLDGKGAIEARQELRAENDDTAIALSTMVFQAFSETYSGFELWSFDRRVMAATPGVGKLAEIVLDDITRDMQQRVLDFEETIHRSHLRVAHSKKLLDATQALRDTLARKEPDPEQPL